MSTSPIELVSFGYLHLDAAPPEAGRVVDVRAHLHDPAAARASGILDMDGRDKQVQKTVLATDCSADLVAELLHYACSLPRNRPRRIAIGCAGGRHRSVALVELLAESLRGLGEVATVEHRHVHLPRVVKEKPRLVTTKAGCVFCGIIAGSSPAKVVRHWDDAMAIVPLDPCTPGHLLVIPRVHVDHADVDKTVTGSVMGRAAELAQAYEHYNLVTSRGSVATQTVFHLHVHVVPRHVGDRLPLPWTPQQESMAVSA